MKQESLVIAYHHGAMNILQALVHTARHAAGFSVSRHKLGILVITIFILLDPF